METFRVLFLPASGPGVGGGHVLRGLALAAELMQRGVTCAFAVEAEGARLLTRFGPGLGVEVLAWGDGLAAIADGWNADAVVIDDYRRGAEGEVGLGAGSRLLIAVDDLADRPHLADLLIDPSHGRDPSDYAALLPAHARVLAGADYALLRPDFARAEPIVVRPGVQRVFVGFGLADPAGVTLRAVRALIPALPETHFDVAVGAAAESLPGLRVLADAEPRLDLHVESDRVAEVMSRADMAVGAGGASTWERFRLGLPSLCAIVADNQRALSLDLARQGFQLAVDSAASDFEARLAAMARGLAADEPMRRRLSEAGRRLCDGQGARRAAAAIAEAVAALQA